MAASPIIQWNACLQAGDNVTLLEKGAELGGSFRIASFPTGKDQLSSAIRAMIVRCEKAGVDIRLNTEADADTLKELHADAIILATGSTPLILPIPGLNESGYVTAQDMLLGKAEVGKKALVVGGGMVGCEAAKAI